MMHNNQNILSFPGEVVRKFACSGFSSWSKFESTNSIFLVAFSPRLRLKEHVPVQMPSLRPRDILPGVVVVPELVLQRSVVDWPHWPL